MSGTSDTLEQTSSVPLRSSSEVMRLARMGAFHQSRLSFTRVLLRRLKSAGWRFDRTRWDINAEGRGTATYRARGPESAYTLVAFAHKISPDQRSDRVIATVWDATFTLFDGEPDEADIERLRHNVPRQEAGRISEKELTLSRANKSVRLFDYVAKCLSSGHQPDPEVIEPVGYLMRTTAVYGSGKFGAADRDKWSQRAEFAGSFQPEMLGVWLTRWFTIDLVEHTARVINPAAVRLDKRLRRRFGVGNSTGLGMAPFLVNHPALIHSWINARELALASIRAISKPDAEHKAIFIDRLQRAKISATQWRTEHPLQAPRVQALTKDLEKLIAHVDHTDLSSEYPWNALYRWGSENLQLEAQEQLVSLLLEPYPSIVDPLCETMSADEASVYRINGQMQVGQLKALLQKTYDWALATRFDKPQHSARVWYVSAEKLEPRLGERFEEPIEPYEQPLAPGRDAAQAYTELLQWADSALVAEFLVEHPRYRQVVRRTQLVETHPYAEIHDNTIDASMLPIDLLRCKLSFFGATRFDPRSDRWVRITLFQDAPYPDELATADPDDMAYPPQTVTQPEVIQ